MNLPPTGQITAETEGEVVAYLSGLAREARDARQPWESVVELNQNIWAYGEAGIPDPEKLVLNKVQNAIIAAVEIQTREPPQVSLEPIETGEPPLHFWAGPDWYGIQFFGLQPYEVTGTIGEDGTMKPPVPLDPLMAGQIKGLAVPEEVSPGLPPGMIRPEWIVELNDRLVAEVYQQLFDVFWDRSQTDLYIRENLKKTNINGWAWGVYEFDDARLRHVLRNMPILQMYIDPTVNDIAEAAYAGFDLPLDAIAAKAQYPYLIDAIEEAAHTGNPSHHDGSTTWGSTFDRNFQRPMVEFRLFWLRNQVVPLDPAEAVALGEVIETAPAFLDGSSPDGAQDEVGYMLADGQPVAPGDPAWPTRIGTRQITLVANRVVDDRECPFYDIPILHNVNIPLAEDAPWGIGEPMRLLAAQNSANSILRSMTRHAEYFAHPIISMSRSMHESLPKEYHHGTSRPGLTLIVEDEQWNQMGGKVHSIQDPPPLPPALPQLYQMLSGAIDSESGHTDALRGISNSGDSGRKVEMLQAAGTSVMGFKAQRTGDMVKRLANLMLHSLVRRLDLADVRKIVSRYPDHILERIIDRARDIEWNVQVRVQSGTGVQVQKRQLAQMDYQIGAISLETYQEDAGRDPDLENRRISLQLQKQAAAGMVQPAGSEGGQEEAA